MKTSRGVGYVAAAFAYAFACGGSSHPSTAGSAPGDGGPADGDDGPSGPQAAADDEGSLASSADAGDEDGGSKAEPIPPTGSYCCVGGRYYACPSQETLAQCTGFDFTTCLQNCSGTDTSCALACDRQAATAKGDASACTPDPSKNGTCAAPDASSSTTTSTSTSVPAPPVTPKNACGGSFTGTQCMVGGVCYPGEHCAGGRCYPNIVGSPCIFGSDCGQNNHCTNGCCANPSKGSPCTTALDCNSMTCTGGVCQ